VTFGSSPSPVVASPAFSASLGTHRQTDAFVAHVLSWYRWVNARAVSFSDAASPVAL